MLLTVAQLGLMLLMFMTGTEIRRVFQRRESKTIGFVFLTGMVLPFLAGIAILQVIDRNSMWGPNGSTASFLLVFAIAMAVTSIPVISRIMHDLGILDTAFARVVLGVAVLEDIVLYVVLAIAVGYAGGKAGRSSGFRRALGIEGGTGPDMIYHAVATLGFMAVCLLVGPPLYRWLSSLKGNLIQRATPIGYQFIFLILITIGGLFLGVEAFFGAFVAGSSWAVPSPTSEATLAIKSFSLAFFIPMYFAMIGFVLDLVDGFSPVFFLGFLMAACMIKALSVYVGARAAGETNGSSWNLAVAMNARGGPGIVVASDGVRGRHHRSAVLRHPGAARHRDLDARGRLARACPAGEAPGAARTSRPAESVEGRAPPVDHPFQRQAARRREVARAGPLPRREEARHVVRSDPPVAHQHQRPHDRAHHADAGTRSPGRPGPPGRPACGRSGVRGARTAERPAPGWRQKVVKSWTPTR